MNDLILVINRYLSQVVASGMKDQKCDRIALATSGRESCRIAAIFFFVNC